MNRRQFLRNSAWCGLSVALGVRSSWARGSRETPIRDIRMIDAHAHPDLYLYDSRSFEGSSNLKAMKELGMAASCFAAVGDLALVAQNRVAGTVYHNTKAQLEWYTKALVKTNKVKLVLKASDIPASSGPDNPPGAILAIEGGDPLEGMPDRVDEFHRYGVRMITLVYFGDNELGEAMTQRPGLGTGPKRSGLTRAGQKVVERMQEIGVVVDVAHASSLTLKQIAEMTAKPIIDSHTSPCAFEDHCGRLRRWQDMELVARSGGIICTWPFSYRRGAISRLTFSDWARENKEMKDRLGMDHVGLGTDGGGRLPNFIEGYRDVRDLASLVSVMEEVGFSRSEIEAYMGGNLYRVLESCMG